MIYFPNGPRNARFEAKALQEGHIICQPGQCRVLCLDRRRKCFYLSFVGVLGDPRWTLVHGTMRGSDGGTDAHAWLERGSRCYDAVADKFFERRAYYELYSAVAEARYAGKKVAQMWARGPQDYFDFGPWHDTTGRLGLRHPRRDVLKESAA